jgi:DNA-binding IclR family transcriptional regulator
MQYLSARELLQVRVRSIEEVEVLLVLRSSDRAWSVPEIVQASDLDTEPVRAALTSLLSRGLVLVRRDGFFYGPSNLAVDGAVGELERLNRSDRAELLAILASAATQRVRSGVSELFVEALRRRGQRQCD